MCMKSPTHIYIPPYMNTSSSQKSENSTSNNIDNIIDLPPAYSQIVPTIMDEKKYLQQKETLMPSKECELPAPVTYQPPTKRPLSKKSVLGYGLIITILFYLVTASFRAPLPAFDNDTALYQMSESHRVSQLTWGKPCAMSKHHSKPALNEGK